MFGEVIILEQIIEYIENLHFDEDDIEMERMFLDVSSPLYGYYVQMEPLKRFTPTREIYDNYLFWCRDKGIKPKALSTFSSQFALVSRSSYKKND